MKEKGMDFSEYVNFISDEISKEKDIKSGDIRIKLGAMKEIHDELSAALSLKDEELERNKQLISDLQQSNHKMLMERTFEQNEETKNEESDDIVEEETEEEINEELEEVVESWV